MKYLRLSISGPYINTTQVSYIEVADDVEEGSSEYDSILSDAIWQYCENSYGEFVDREDIPEGEL